MTATNDPAIHERFHFQDAAALRRKAVALGLDLPFSERIEGLFEKAELAERAVANRLAIHPMEGADARPDGSPGPLTERRYRRFGAGGCGIIWFEAAAVVPEGRSNPGQLLLQETTLDGFSRLIEATRDAADVAETNPPPLLILQLTHSGRFSRPTGKSAPLIARHDPVLDSLSGLPADHPLIDDDFLDRLSEKFGAAAALAQRAGFDGVDMKACHGYLAAELLAARRREGRYGGPLENRSRFLIQAFRAARAEASRFILACRLGVFDGLDGGFGVKGRAFAAELDPQAKLGAPAARTRPRSYSRSSTAELDPQAKLGAPAAVDAEHSAVPDMSEPIEVVRQLATLGVSLLNITAGIPAHRPQIGRPFDVPPRGAAFPDEHPLAGVARLLNLAARAQREFPSLPVVGTGYSWLRGFFPRVAAGTLSRGGARFIGLGRLAFACPDFALRLREEGELDRTRTCIACSECSALLRAGGPVGCVVRDANRYHRRTASSARD